MYFLATILFASDDPYFCSDIFTTRLKAIEFVKKVFNKEYDSMNSNDVKKIENKICFELLRTKYYEVLDDIDDMDIHIIIEIREIENID